MFLRNVPNLQDCIAAQTVQRARDRQLTSSWVGLPDHRDILDFTQFLQTSLLPNVVV
jgi:hypothetical protein